MYSYINTYMYVSRCQLQPKSCSLKASLQIASFDIQLQ